MLRIGLSGYGSLIGQGSEETVRKLSMRIIFGTTLIFGSLSANILAARFTSIFSVTRTFPLVSSLEVYIYNAVFFL